MNLEKLVEINRRIEEIEKDPEKSSYEKYIELVKLKNEFEKLKNTENQKTATKLLKSLNVVFSLN